MKEPGVYPEGFQYVVGFLSVTEQEDLLAAVRGLAFQHDVFRGQRLKRGYAQFGFAYRSIGRKLDPAPPMPAFLTELIGKVLTHCRAGTVFDQVIITRYPAGAGIGWHVDAPCFRECIAGISLGTGCRFQFRAVASATTSHELIAAPGSLYLMSGPSRADYEHQVVPVKGERYSITCRGVG